MKWDSRLSLCVGTTAAVVFAIVAYVVHTGRGDVAMGVEHVINAHSLPYVGDSETLIFHAGHCRNAERIPTPRRIYFQSHAAAVGRGFFSCGACNPRPSN